MDSIETCPCFICGKSLETPAHDNPTTWSPVMDGLWFRAYGNFGSTVFDPISGEHFLRICICDKCILERQKQISVVSSIQTKKTGTGPFPWTPETYYD